MKTINRNADEAKGVFIPIQRESPKGRQHLHTMEAGAWLPIVQATETGLVIGVVCLVLAFVTRARDPWNWGLVPGILAWGIDFLALLRHWFSLTKLEEVTGMDLGSRGGAPDDAGTGPAPLPEDNPRVIQVRLNEVKDGHLKAQRRYEIHASDNQMAALARGLLQENRQFTVREWCGAGKPFSVEQFISLRAEMVRGEMLVMASEKDARRGFVLTKAGRAVLEDYLTNFSV